MQKKLQSALGALATLLTVAVSAHATTTTRTYTHSCPPPGGGTATHKITTEDESGKVVSVETTNCAGVTKTTTYSYSLNQVNTWNPNNVGEITKSGTNFSVTTDSKVEIVNINSGTVAYTYPSTITASTSTAIWSGLGTGLYLLVARDPSNNTTVYDTLPFYY